MNSPAVSKPGQLQFALDCDLDRDTCFGGHTGVLGWMQRLREHEGFEISHRAWNAVVPLPVRRLREIQPERIDFS